MNKIEIIILLTFLFSVVAVTADADLLVLDPGLREAVILNNSGDVKTRISGIGKITDFAIDPVTGDCFAVHSSKRQVIQFDRNGKLKRYYDWFEHPVSLSVSATGTSFWVTDSIDNCLVEINKSGFILRTIPGFDYPTDINTGTSDGRIWVVDRGNHSVTRLDSAGVAENHCDWSVKKVGLPTTRMVMLSNFQLWSHQ